MATGDLKNNIKQLQSELKATRFTQTIDLDGLISGSAQAYLGIYHYLFTTYNTQLNSDISNSNNELYGKSDMRFMEAVYKILRDMFDYKPQINREQFFTPAYAERKVIMATDILRLVRRRYKPPKSSTFRVAAARDEAKISPREKVQQEPFERPRKIASKSPPDMAGAIVLHKSAGGGYKIPKSAVLSQRVSYEDPFLGNPPVTTKTHKKKPINAASSFTDENDEDYAEAVQESNNRSRPVIVKESPDSLMRHMFSELVSPALLKVNEKIGQLEIGVTKLEKKEQHKIISDQSSPPSHVAGLTKQMADVIFKLETLTSRIVLIENRLLMIEAKLDGDDNFKQVAHIGSSYHSPKRDAADTSKLVWSNRNNNNNIYSLDEEILPRENYGTKTNSESNITNNDDDDDDKSIIDDMKVVVIQENVKAPKVLNSKMEFIKTLMNTNDLENTLNSDVISLDTSEVKEGQKLTPKSAKATKIMEPLFDDTVSPIKAYSASSRYAHIQDDSVMSNSNEAEIAVDKDDRRSSTPTHFMLDSSTMDRVSRISQMMTETKQLLH